MNKKKQLSSKNNKCSVAIELKNITKTYIVHHEKPTFVENVLKNGHKEKFTALDNISLTVYQGERIGIIGPNGSGKTTLLKIIAGITTVDSGAVKTNGRVVSLIDLAAGFHPDLTGEENIFLNGLVIGMSKKEISAKINKIVAFADIGSFIDAPLYTYSAGMILRLGFSVAVHAEPDILVLDEVLLVGDVNFQKKTTTKIREFAENNRTIVMSSHMMELLKTNTDRIISLEELSL